jgi:hypothetical protein
MDVEGEVKNGNRSATVTVDKYQQLSDSVKRSWIDLTRLTVNKPCWRNCGQTVF